MTSSNKLGWLAATSVVLGTVGAIVSVFGASDGLGQEIVQNCHSEEFRRKHGVMLSLGIFPLDWTWCGLTIFIKGFTDSTLSMGVSARPSIYRSTSNTQIKLIQLVLSLVIPFWGYFAAVMMAATPTRGMRPWSVAILVLASQLFGFQAILTVYWIPLLIKQKNWTLTRSAIRGGATTAVFWTVVLQFLAGSVLLLTNIHNEWWFQRSQIVFQVSERPLHLLVLVLTRQPKFYPVITPAVHLALRTFSSDDRRNHANSNQQHLQLSRAFERLGLVSLLLSLGAASHSCFFIHKTRSRHLSHPQCLRILSTQS